MKVAMTLNFFPGGEAYDIALVFGVSHSILIMHGHTINPINTGDKTKLWYPESHEKQKEIGDGFLKYSLSYSFG